MIGQKLEPLFATIKKISDGAAVPSYKLHQMKAQLLPQLPGLSGELGTNNESYHQLLDTVAVCLRVISIDAHNDHQDFETAKESIQLALNLAKDSELKNRIKADQQALSSSIQQTQLHTALRTHTAPTARRGSGCLILVFIPIIGIGSAAWFTFG